MCFHHQWLKNVAQCQWLHVSRQPSQKKKWTKDEISSLRAWKYETNVIYGPVVNLKKARDTVSREKAKAMLAVSADDLKLNNCQAAVGFTAEENADSDTCMANLPCSESRNISSETVLKDPVETLTSPAVVNSFNSGNRKVKVTKNTGTKTDPSGKLKGDNSKLKGDNVVFDSTNRDGTYGYQWVDSPVRRAPAKKDGREENIVASFTETANTNRETVKQKTDQVNHPVGNMHRVSDTESDQSKKNRAADLQTDGHKTDNVGMDQNILSFPLFDSSVLPIEPASLSTRLPSVSAILKATMPPESQLALSRWEQRMIAELGEDGFKEYQRGR